MNSLNGRLLNGKWNSKNYDYSVPHRSARGILVYVLLVAEPTLLSKDKAKRYVFLHQMG